MPHYTLLENGFLVVVLRPGNGNRVVICAGHRRPGEGAFIPFAQVEKGGRCGFLEHRGSQWLDNGKAARRGIDKHRTISIIGAKPPPVLPDGPIPGEGGLCLDAFLVQEGVEIGTPGHLEHRLDGEVGFPGKTGVGREGVGDAVAIRREGRAYGEGAIHTLYPSRLAHRGSVSLRIQPTNTPIERAGPGEGSGSFAHKPHIGRLGRERQNGFRQIGLGRDDEFIGQGLVYRHP